MAYAVRTDVEGLIAQFTLDANSKPTQTQADTLIDDTGDEIDVVLSSAGVAVPVTTPTYFKEALKFLNAYGAAAAILRAMFPDATGSGETPAYAFWEARYKAGLKGLKDGSHIPPGVTRSAGYVPPSTYLTRNPDEEEDLGDIAEPQFKVGQVF